MRGGSLRGDDDPTSNGECCVTGGVDIGTRLVKISLMAHGAGKHSIIGGEIVAVQGRRDARDAQVAIRESWDRVLRATALTPSDVALVASTGVNERAPAHVGQFYRRQSLVEGVRFLFAGATAVLDIGARQIRCAVLDRDGAGKRYAATRKDTICGGETLETVARRAGVAIDGAALLPGAVAAYDDLAARASQLIAKLDVQGPTVIAGAMGMDVSFVRILARRLEEDAVSATLLVSPHAIFAGAYGAALLARRRYLRVLGSVGGYSGPRAQRRPLRVVDRLRIN
jgi:activator of 2-hydroxyglutaryl-CoA dehydratase